MKRAVSTGATLAKLMWLALRKARTRGVTSMSAPAPKMKTPGLTKLAWPWVLLVRRLGRTEKRCLVATAVPARLKPLRT